MHVRCRHDRGDIGASPSDAGLVLPLDDGGISISGLSVLLVEEAEIVILDDVRIGLKSQLPSSCMCGFTVSKGSTQKPLYVWIQSIQTID